MATSLLTMAVAMVVIAAVSVEVSMAQSTTPSCASQLIPCAQFLNATTKPPNTCCDPIQKAVTTDLKCLCSLYENPTFLNQIGINVTQALNLPKLCGIPASTSACTSATSPTSSALPPPGTPGNGVDKIASSGMFSLLFVSICFVFFH